MLPLPVNIFITQLVALLGVTAIERIVVLIAYYLKDFDIQLMYHENIFRHLERFKDYNNSNSKKWLVIVLSSVTLVTSFLPTFLSITGDIKDTQHVSYTNIKTTDSQYYLSPISVSLASMPLFVDFYNNNQEPANLTGILLENYVTSISKETTENPSGIWYNAPSVHFFPKQQLQRWANDANYPPTPQIVSNQGVFTLQQRDNQKPAYFLSYNNKVKGEGSSSLENCVDNDPFGGNIVNNLNSIEGHQVQGVHAYNRTCYPVTDPSLWLVAAQEREINNADSLLNTMDDLYYRSPLLTQQSSASYSMGIVSSIWDNLNQQVMMIKKSAHITIYYDDNSRLLTQENCISDATTNKITFNQDINFIACQLVALAKQNPALSILQATRRTFDSNRILNSVYTYVRKDNGHGIMIDLTQYSGYNVPKSMQDSYFDREMFIGYQKVKKSNFETIDFEQLLQSINPFPDINTEYGLNTITDLVLFGAGLLGNSYDGFLRTTAIVLPSVKVSVAWIAVTVAFAALFIFVIVIASFIAPEAYKTNLRSLLIHTLITLETENTTDDPNLNRKRKLSLSTRAVKLEGRQSLKMDGTAIILSENIPMANQTVAADI